MILYANSCSYGVCSTGKTYVDFLGDLLNVDTVINAGVGGSCNNRILRTSIRDILELQDTDDILVLISLGAMYRSELWKNNTPANGKDGHFYSFQISSLDNNQYNTSESNEYMKQWYRQYADEAEATNLYFLLNMFTSFLEVRNIKYLIWAGAANYKLVDFSAPFIESLHEPIANNPKIIDPFSFSFSKYCSIIKGYMPYDSNLYGVYGHHTEEAHKDFANYIFENYLK